MSSWSAILDPDEQTEADGILGELEAAGVFARSVDVAEPHFEGRLDFYDHDMKGRARSPDWSNYYPMRLPKRAPCDLCSRRRDHGFGCVTCLGWMCLECVRGGKHCRCTPSVTQAMTLQELGDAFGVTRERVRQLEIRGLRRLRQRAHILDEFSVGYELREQRRFDTVARITRTLGAPAPRWVGELVRDHKSIAESFVAADRKLLPTSERALLAADLAGATDATAAAAVMSRVVAAVDRCQRELRRENDRRRAEAEERKRAAAQAEEDAEAYALHRAWLESGGAAKASASAGRFEVVCALAVARATVMVRVRPTHLDALLIAVPEQQLQALRSFPTRFTWTPLQNGERAEVWMPRGLCYLCVGNKEREKALDVRVTIESYTLEEGVPAGVARASRVEWHEDT